MKNIPVIDKLFSRDIVWWHFGCATAVIVVLDMLLSDTPFFTPLQFFKWLLFGATVWALLSLTSRRSTPELTETTDSSEQYRGLLEQASDGVIVLDRQGHIVSATPGAQQLIGHTSQTLSSINVADILSDDELCVQPLRIAGLFEGQTLSGERWMRRKSGGSFPVEISARQTDPEQVTLALRDLSKRKKAEETLRKSEQYYRALADTTAAFIVDENGLILYSTPAVESFIGYTSAELTGQSFTQVLHPDEATLVQKKLPVLEQHPDSSEDIRLVHKDGSFRTVETRAKSLDNNAGTLLTFHDATERKKREKELRLFQTALENAETGVLLVEVREETPGTVAYSNPAWSQLAGIPAEKVVGQPADVAFGNSDVSVVAALHESLLDGLARSGSSTLADDRTIPVPVEWNILPLRSGSERITHVMYTVRDNSGQQRAEQRDHEKAALLDMLNHKFRTPMHSVLGLSETLARHAGNTVHMQMAELVHSDATNVMAAIESTLWLAGVLPASAPDEITPIDIKTEVETLLDKYRVSARDKGIKLYFDTISDEVFAKASPTVLHECMANLLGNAFRLTHKGSITVQVFTGEYNGSLHAAVRIIDTGSGVPQDILPHLFDEPYQQQADNNRLYAGSDLELVFVRRLLDVANGGITVESEQGRGSIFTVYLPLAESADTTPTSVSFPEQTDILFVGNTFSDTGVVLGRYLDGIAKITEAEGGAAAVEQASQQHYNLVLVDTTLGNIIDPADIIAALHSIPGYTSIPAIALTDCTSSRDTDYLLQAGFAEYLTKPFSRRQLLDAITRCLTVQEAG
jgi:PAS domain S-box-containing protein